MTFRQKAARWDEVGPLYVEMTYNTNDPFQLTDYEKDMEKFNEMFDSRLYTSCIFATDLEGGLLSVNYLVTR